MRDATPWLTKMTLTTGSAGWRFRFEHRCSFEARETIITDRLTGCSRPLIVLASSGNPTHHVQACMRYVMRIDELSLTNRQQI
jgi:hypothetical protein